MKKCSKCGIEKEFNCFYNRKESSDGLNAQCKSCIDEYDREKYQNIEEREKIINRNKKYKSNNRERINKTQKEYQKNNKEKINEYQRKYKEKNRVKVINYQKNYKKRRYNEDILFRLSSNIRSSIIKSLDKIGTVKNNRTTEILACSIVELIEHLNDNIYGFEFGDDNLDIDHIIPLSSAKTEEEIYELNHYSNLQLLPSYYNRYIKRNKTFNIVDFEKWFISQNII